MAERSNASSTSSLTLPPMLGTSPDGGASPRRAVSPLLEVRRPHCTLNCESCNMYLEDIYRHSTWSIRCPSRVVYAPDSSFRFGISNSMLDRSRLMNSLGCPSSPESSSEDNSASRSSKLDASLTSTRSRLHRQFDGNDSIRRSAMSRKINVQSCCRGSPVGYIVHVRQL